MAIKVTQTQLDAIRQNIETLTREITVLRQQFQVQQIEVDTLRMTIVLYQNDLRVERPPRLSRMLESALAREYEREAIPGD